MRATAGPKHKALVPVGGFTLLERNLRTLLTQGFRSITIVSSSKEPDIAAFLMGPIREIARDYGGTLTFVTEDEPLGNMGILWRFKDTIQPILVTYVDNLSALDLNSMVDYHVANKATLTIAVHEQAFQMPYGKIEVVDRRIVDYLEKPVSMLKVSSGYFVVEPRACAYIIPGAFTNIVDLFRMLKQAGEAVMAFEHSSPWVDVNDATTLAEAERLVSDHADEFNYSLFPVETQNAK
jgi:NDP-sugar pyrophosphorylase family protein